MQPKPISINALPLKDIHEAPYNPRMELKPGDKEYESLKKSLARWGQVEPLVINKHNKTLVGGHQRFHVMKDLGFKLAIVAYVDIKDPREEKALNIALNKIGGAWDEDKLAIVLEDIRSSDFDIGLTGFSTKELDKLLKDVGEHEPPEDIIPDAPKVPVTKPGDFWKLGDHVIACADAFDATARKKLLGTTPVALIVTDPPYAIYGSSTGISTNIADDKMVRPFFQRIFGAVNENLKKFGHLYMFCDWRTWPSIWEEAKRAEMSAKNLLIWDKGSGMGRNYANYHEMIGFFHRNPVRKSIASSEEIGQRSVLKPNIFRVNRPFGEERKHNAAKPVPILIELIENSSNDGDIVLDYFMGSGSTLMAAEKSGRKSLGFEIEPKFCDVIVERWQVLTGKKAKRA